MRHRVGRERARVGVRPELGTGGLAGLRDRSTPLQTLVAEPERAAQEHVEHRDDQHRRQLDVLPVALGEVRRHQHDHHTHQPEATPGDRSLRSAAVAGRRDAGHVEGDRQRDDQPDTDQQVQDQRGQEGADLLSGVDRRAAGLRRVGRGVDRDRLRRQHDEQQTDEERLARERDRDRVLGSRRTPGELHGLHHPISHEFLNRNEHTVCKPTSSRIVIILRYHIFLY